MVRLYGRLIEIIKYRELILRLVLKELKLRYKQPYLGFLWAFIVPLCLIIIFMVIFSYILKVPDYGYPFFLFLFSAILPWNFLNLSVSTSVMSLIENSGLIKKVYFPREIIPISIVILNLVLFIFGLGLMLVFIVFYGVRLNYLILFLPLVILMQAIFICGLCLIITSLQVKYRDIKYIVEVIFIFWFYLTPIFYPLETISGISDKLFNLYMLNPLTQQITLYRVIIIDGYLKVISGQVNLFKLVVFSSASSIFTFILGLGVFKKQERSLSDLL